MILIKSVAQPPQGKKQDTQQVQKFISVLEQKQQRYLSFNENKFLLSYLSLSPLLKDMQDKHIVAKAFIQNGQYIRLEKGEVLPSSSGLVSFIISGRLENQSILTKRKSNITSLQSTLNSKEMQQMSFSQVQNLIEPTEPSNMYSNDISHLVPLIDCVGTPNNRIQNKILSLKISNKSVLFTLNKQFIYTGSEKEECDQNSFLQDENQLIAQSTCYLMQMEMKTFLNHFDLFLKQILFVTQSLVSSPFQSMSKQQAAIISTKFKEQYFFSKNNIDLAGDILIVKQGCITLYRDGSLQIVNQGQIVGLEFYENKQVLDIVSISTPLVCFVLSKIQQEYVNQIFESLQLTILNKEQIRCNSAINSSSNFNFRGNQISCNNSLLLNQNNSLNSSFIDTALSNMPSQNAQLFSERLKCQSQGLKPNIKRNSVILESTIAKYSDQSYIQQQKNKITTNRLQIRKASVGNNSTDSLNAEEILQNKAIIDLLQQEENNQYTKLHCKISRNVPFSPSKLSSQNNSIFDNQIRHYNFIKRNHKSNYCVKDTMFSERIQKSLINKNLSNSNLEKSQAKVNTTYSSPLKNVLAGVYISKNQEATQNQQQKELKYTQQKKLSYHSFYQYPLQTEQIRGGSLTDRPLESNSNYQQQQKIVTITSFRSKSKNKYQRRYFQSSEPTQKAQLQNFQRNFNQVVNEKNRSQENLLKERLKQLENQRSSRRSNHFQEQDFLSKSTEYQQFEKNDNPKLIEQIDDGTNGTQEGDANEEGYIQLKQKYENGASYDQTNLMFTTPDYKYKQYKNQDLKQPKKKRMINDYNEIQQEIQWENLKAKLINDLINKKLEETNSDKAFSQIDNLIRRDRQQIMNQSSKTEQKKYELNILSFIQQNSIENSPISSIANKQNIWQKQNCLENKEIRPINGVHINSLHLDNNPLQNQKFCQKQLAQTAMNNFNFINCVGDNQTNKLLKKSKQLNQSARQQIKNTNSNITNQSPEASANINQGIQQKVFIKNVDISQNPSIQIKNTYNSSRKKKTIIRKKQEPNSFSFESLQNLTSLDIKQNS